MYPPRTESGLGYRKAAVQLAEQILAGYTNVAVNDLRVATMPAVVVAEDARRSLDDHTWYFERYDDHRLLAVWLATLVGLAHHDGNLAPRAHGAARPCRRC